MTEELAAWRKDGKHLPAFLKDFHDQKDFFKFLHEFQDLPKHEMLSDFSFVEGQVYTLDILLWTLARFGWTLQKSRAHQEFEDVNHYIAHFNAQRLQASANMLKAATPSKNPDLPIP